MTETEVLVLENLRAIRADLSERSDVRETKTRLGSLEDLNVGLSGLYRSLFGLYMNLSERLDSLVTEMRLIGRRLGD